MPELSDLRILHQLHNRQINLEPGFPNLGLFQIFKYKVLLILAIYNININNTNDYNNKVELATLK